MHPRTQSTLDELDQAEWFRTVGVKGTQVADVLSSWTEAIDWCSSLEWENLLLEASNQYRERLVERSVERFRRWNDLVFELQPVTTALVREKTARVVEVTVLPKVFVDTVEWDVLGVCLEAEYADVYPPGFYAAQAYWYVADHFHCGWRGTFPEGRLVVY